MAKTRKKVLVVTHTPGGDAQSVNTLTEHLNDGWRLMSSTAMGGVGGYDGPVRFAALVVLERDDTTTVGGFSSS